MKKAVLRMARINLGIKPKEKVSVLTDNLAKMNKLAKDIYSILKMHYNCSFLSFPPTGQHGKEPPMFVADELKRFDVILMLTTYSLSHTKAREAATKKGARIASMPGFTREMFSKKGPMNQDHKKIALFTNKILKILSKSKTALITSNNKTNLKLRLGRKAHSDTGILTKKSSFSNLPAGEAYTSPRDAEGTLVINKGYYEGLKKDLIFVFKKGYLADFRGGGKIGAELKKLFFKKRHRRKIAELGIGTNPGAKNPVNTLESEKILGTVHIALGDSSHFGGNNFSDIHIDFILNKPTLKLNNKILIKNGKYK